MSETPVVLLHGALGSAETMYPLRDALGALLPGRPLITPHLEGHGPSPLPSGGLAVESLALGVLRDLEERGTTRADFVGYSLGGYLALWLARHRPERVGRVLALATKLAWTPEVAARERSMLDPEKLQQKVPRFAQLLSDRHGADRWAALLRATADLMTGLGERPAVTTPDLEALEIPVLLAVGDRDATVSLEETAGAYRALRHGSLAVLPNTPHPLERAPLTLLAQSAAAFLQLPVEIPG
ncbi:pimeloyl-ACP methyl ester carboxylesterase [Deinobacterium chartae]|uniref:Pimeloyl-ACP methyl ester carboxylesterase n=1 Tax=Deinobacterium chartae TaxID=521158 RepID=A0A841HWX3_9DEIO|nr:alpha/beta fold hydrolase [Deinobacterium chartae]MBB6098021.1 pimeloyl-ACP methyl ester carboxylesterase [Deinobacterium chartae]